MASLIPQNSAAFSLAEAAALCGGVLLGEDAACVGITTDSRHDLRGQLFVALRGERFDGHEFAREAADRGAAGVLVEREVPGLAIGAVKVASTLTALGTLGSAHRRRWGKRLVAVAGSAGKTTTRSTITALLSALPGVNVHFAAGNLNNLIGVPLVLLGLRAGDELGVVEIGTNAPGEVRTLSLLAEPNVAVLTLIGIEHSEGLGDIDGIEREEGEIWSGLSASGVAVWNADDERVRRTVSEAKPAISIGYGKATDASYRLLSRSSTALGGSRLQIERHTAHVSGSITLETPLLGDAGAYATLAALAVAEWVASSALSAEIVNAALGTAGEPGRLTPITLADGTVLLDDSYNSNPASVESSLTAAREVATARHARLLLVIGEMRELGPRSVDFHREVAENIAKSGASRLIAVGGDAAEFVAPAQARGLAAEFAANADDALSLLLAQVEPGDVVLVKASRGVRAERVVRGLLEAKGRAA